jgi:hypothetical protein
MLQHSQLERLIVLFGDTLLLDIFGEGADFVD